MENKPSKVIGYWLSEKKTQKLNWTEFGNVCGKYGFDLVKLDLNHELEDQGPFTAHAMISRVERYINCHPEVAIVDPLENVRKLLDRYCSYSIIHNSGLDKAVCKPSVAHGSSNAHKMAVIFNEKGIKDCRPPCVAQSFVNHNAILYKIYLVGDEHYVVERPSLKNFYPSYPSDRETIFFDSHDVSKADSTSSLSILDPADRTINPQRPDAHKLQHIVRELRKELGMALLGIDVVIENGSGRYGIIDINAYPGYDGYPNFFQSLMNYILEIINNHPRNSDSISPGDDSGFDTGDSSDEKKKQSALNESLWFQR
ncbi:Inositol-tetrakisphosphate 1-kinase [Blattella germanica]|nr:Inositol-tetrakisphosphate 1-kinase [Blattella germanica]